MPLREMQSHHDHSNGNRDYRQVKFCGRLDELNALRHAFEAASLDRGPIAYSVFIEGESGSGKSALIRAFRDSLISNNETFVFCRGKFEEGGAAVEPFATVLTMCNSMVHQMLPDEESRDVWRDRLCLDMSQQDMAIVRDTIPLLHAIIPELDVDSTLSDTNDAWGFDRLRFALRSLIRTVSHYIPLVLFMDDLQWAGEDALMLLQAIIIDQEPNRHLMILGAYRPVRDDHPLVTRVLTQRGRRPRSRRACHAGQNLSTDISLLDLSESETLEYLASYLGVNDVKSVQSLRDVVFRKTRGNPFFMLQFLRFLECRGCVSRVNGSFVRHSDLVDAELEFGNDVLSVVKNEIRSMDPLHQNLLSTVGCLGTLKFNLDIVVHVFDVIKDSGRLCSMGLCQPDAAVRDSSVLENVRKELMRILTIIASKGIIESVSGGFRFGHDRMREGCYSLTSSETRQAMHLAIGRHLLQALHFDHVSLLKVNIQNGLRERDKEIRVHAVSQMNLGMALVTDVEERRKLASLNFAMAELAISRSGYFPASEFLEKGITAISGDNIAIGWQKDYDLILKLSTAKARIDYCCGFWNSAIEHADAVIANARSIQDRIPAYHTKTYCLVQINESIQSKELDLSVLAMLGVRYPRKMKWCSVLVEIVKTRKMLQGKTDDDLLNLPDTYDVNTNLTCDFFRHLIEVLYLSVIDVNVLLLTIIYVLQISLTKGRFKLTGLGLVQYGALLAYLHRYSEAYRFGSIGLQIAMRDGHCASIAKNIFHSFIAHWKFPLHESVACISPLVRRSSYSEATRHSCFIVVSFYSGRRLDGISNDILRNAEALEDYNDYIAYDHTAPLFQMVSILTGDSPNEVRLTGRYMDEDDLLQNAASWNNLIPVYFCKFFLACFFADLPMAAKLLRVKIPTPLVRSTHPERPYWPFLCGLLAYRLARANRDSNRCVFRYKKRGRAALRELRMWQSRGMRTWSFMVFMLTAEDYALSCFPGSSTAKVDKVLNMYEMAISSIVNYTDFYMHFRGLANERAAEFALEHNRFDQASSCLVQAHFHYRRWGASAKVLHLELMHHRFLSPKLVSRDAQIVPTL